MDTFLTRLSAAEQKVMNQMRALILDMDSSVKEKTGNIMSSKDCFIYEEDGVFKYGLAKTKNHFSFHSMVMYANPSVKDYIEKNAKTLKIQKGCINFIKAHDFPLDTFKQFLTISAAADFSQVLNHYKTKK